VHVYYPGPIETPGYHTGNANKAESTKNIEGKPISSERACNILLNGISAGQSFITTHDTYRLLSIGVLGAVIRDSLFIDFVFSGMSVVFAIAYSYFIQFCIRSNRKKI